MHVQNDGPINLKQPETLSGKGHASLFCHCTKCHWRKRPKREAVAIQTVFFLFFVATIYKIAKKFFKNEKKKKIHQRLTNLIYLIQQNDE